MKITNEAKKLLHLIYDRDMNDNPAEDKDILDEFSYLSRGQLKLTLNYLNDLSFIDLLWLLPKPDKKLHFLIRGITPQGINRIECPKQR